MKPRNYKERQAARLTQIGEALYAAGFLTLKQQAEATGLGRSTIWFITKGNHKHSGLQPKIIKRMLDSPKLPPSVRKIVLDYVAERLRGQYGHRHKHQQKLHKVFHRQEGRVHETTDQERVRAG